MLQNDKAAILQVVVVLGIAVVLFAFMVHVVFGIIWTILSLTLFFFVRELLNKKDSRR